jgi:hypothetical protein
MNGIGGRTQWYCPSCGRAVAVGGACVSCGSGGVPEGPVVAEETGRPLAGLRRVVAGLLARSNRAE